MYRGGVGLRALYFKSKSLRFSKASQNMTNVGMVRTEHHLLNRVGIIEQGIPPDLTVRGK